MLKVFKHKSKIIEDKNIEYAYYTTLVMGAFFGSFIIGSLNTIYSLDTENITIGKSVLGAIVGGVIVAELFKKVMNIKGSTGAYFVPSLALGIAIGRIGCFFAGLEDYTYGVATDFFLGYDFGDGILRHPVQLYESTVMSIFFIYTVWIYLKDRVQFEKIIFYQFIFLYSTQRSIWEFLKPYETILWSLNIFHLFCFGLIVYSIYMWRTS
jgi:prolipoprotein diacylglyceryltransferase